MIMPVSALTCASAVHSTRQIRSTLVDRSRLDSGPGHDVSGLVGSVRASQPPSCQLGPLTGWYGAPAERRSPAKEWSDNIRT